MSYSKKSPNRGGGGGGWGQGVYRGIEEMSCGNYRDQLKKN